MRCSTGTDGAWQGTPHCGPCHGDYGCCEWGCAQQRNTPSKLRALGVGLRTQQRNTPRKCPHAHLMNSWPTVAAAESVRMDARASGCREMKLHGARGRPRKQWGGWQPAARQSRGGRAHVCCASLLHRPKGSDRSLAAASMRGTPSPQAVPTRAAHGGHTPPTGSIWPPHLMAGMSWPAETRPRREKVAEKEVTYRIWL